MPSESENWYREIYGMGITDHEINVETPKKIKLY
jgi:hypothetical protein